jgi:hypothetical protein
LAGWYWCWNWYRLKWSAGVFCRRFVVVVAAEERCSRNQEPRLE